MNEFIGERRWSLLRIPTKGRLERECSLQYLSNLCQEKRGGCLSKKRDGATLYILVEIIVIVFEMKGEHIPENQVLHKQMEKPGSTNSDWS